MSQAEKTAALSAACKSLKVPLSNSKSGITPLCDKYCALQTQATNIQTAMTVNVDAGASAAGIVRDWEMSLVSAEVDPCTLQVKQCTLNVKESQLVDICNGFEGQVLVLSAEFHAAQVKLPNLT